MENAMESEVEIVHEWLKSRNIVVPNDWVNQCVPFVKEILEEKGLRDTRENTTKEVFEQWMLADLRELREPVFPRHIPTARRIVLTNVYCVQVNSMVDVSASAYSQYQKCAALENENANVDAEAEEQTKPWEPKPTRMLSMELTDGVITVRGIEDRPIPALRLDCQPGFKIRLSGRIESRKGILFLGPDNVEVIGGNVESLLEENMLSKILKRKLAALPSTNRQAPSPPKKPSTISKNVDAGRSGQIASRPVVERRPESSRPSTRLPLSPKKIVADRSDQIQIMDIDSPPRPVRRPPPSDDDFPTNATYSSNRRPSSPQNFGQIFTPPIDRRPPSPRNFATSSSKRPPSPKKFTPPFPSRQFPSPKHFASSFADEPAPPPPKSFASGSASRTIVSPAHFAEDSSRLTNRQRPPLHKNYNIGGHDDDVTPLSPAAKDTFDNFPAFNDDQNYDFDMGENGFDEVTALPPASNSYSASSSSGCTIPLSGSASIHTNYDEERGITMKMIEGPVPFWAQSSSNSVAYPNPPVFATLKDKMRAMEVACGSTLCTVRGLILGIGQKLSVNGGQRWTIAVVVNDGTMSIQCDIDSDLVTRLLQGYTARDAYTAKKRVPPNATELMSIERAMEQMYHFLSTFDGLIQIEFYPRAPLPVGIVSKIQPQSPLIKNFRQFNENDLARLRAQMMKASET